MSVMQENFVKLLKLLYIQCTSQLNEAGLIDKEK